jgi:tripartite-type tricarboxylate transporter receptor subunit TctC
MRFPFRPALLALAFPLVAWAQAFPAKPIRVILPFTAGGAPDFVPRLIAEKAGPALGQPVVIEYRPGAGGVIAAEAVAAAAPDGYTLLHHTSGHLMPPFLTKNVRFDPVKDFTPIMIDVEATLYLIVNPSLPVHTVADLVEFAKRNPGKLAYGSSGVGSLYHLTGELVKMSAGIDMVHVPYKGSPQTLADLIANQIQVTFGGANILPHVKSGKVRILAHLDSRRINPEIPAITETLPAYRKLPSWFGFLGPAGMSVAVVKRLESEFVKATLSPELKPKWDEGGFVIVASSAEQFAATMQSDIELITRIVKAAGIQPE